MKNIFADLNKVQQEAVSELNGPILIIAGAGSGKTRVLTYKIANLIQHDVYPSSILALTFTNKAAGEMKERIKKVLNTKVVPIWAGTFHSIFTRILKKEAEHIGYSNSFSIYDAEDSLRAIKRIMNDLNISNQQFNPKAIRMKISILKNNLIYPTEYAEVSKFGMDLATAKVYTDYEKYLIKCNAMDFDSLLLNMIKLFESKKEILEKYQERFKYILVDEYQDTNKVQYKIIKMLANKHQNLCVVGDDAQSIYSFRGADISNILDFEKDYKNSKTFRLEQNYRSTKSILQIADTLIKNNKNQLSKNLWTENDIGEKVILHLAGDEKDEAKYVINQIFNFNSSYNLNDIVVLYRTNAQSRVIEDALRRNAISYKIVGGVEFYQRKEIKDILSYLRLLVNKSDNESFLRVINYPTRGVGDVTLDKIKLISKNQMWGDVSLFEVIAKDENLIQLSDKAKKSITEFRNLILKFTSMLNTFSFSEVVRTLIDEIGIVEDLKSEKSDEALVRVENVYELLSAIAEFCETKEEPTLEKFLEEVSLMSSVDKYDSEKNAVTLMTLHSAKGLEYKIVFIVGIEEGLLPSGQTINLQEEVEEERRLFYVGITRAMERLFLLHAKYRFRFNELNVQLPSRFLEEIDKKYVLETSTAFNANKINSRVLKPIVENSRHFDYENESQDTFKIKIGSKVEHETFGLGKITHLVGKGENQKAVVWFEEYGQKNLMIKFAPMRILN